MASPTLSAVLLLAFLLLVAPGAGAFDEHVDGDDDDGRFLLLDCGGGGGSSGTAPKNSSANLASLLAALPSVAAPASSAVLSNGSAFVRGVCIGNDSSTDDCSACLAAAAGNITGGGCGGATGRRGGAWSDGCFLAYYADASAAAARNDSRKVLCHGDTPRSYLDDDDDGDMFVDYYDDYWTDTDQTFYCLAMELEQRAADEPAARMLAAGEKTKTSPYGYGTGTTTVRAMAQCTGDAADCLRCLRGSARQAVMSCGSAGAGWLRGGRVLTYGCYLRFEVSYSCGDPLQPADDREATGRAGCSAAPARASGGGFLRWLITGALAAAVLLHGGQRGM